MTDRPLRIVLINASDAGGGAERSILTLHQSLRSLGHDSTLYVGEKRTEQPGVYAIPYVRGLPGSRRFARWVEALTGWQDIYNPGFRRLVRAIPADTDVVHFHNLWGSAAYADIGVLPAITSRCPGVFTERQNWSFTGHCACFLDCLRWQNGCGHCPHLETPPAIPRDGTRHNWLRKRSVVRRSRLVFVGISDHVCRLARQSPIWHGKRIVRIYNGIDHRAFSPASSLVRARRRGVLGIGEDRVAVLIAGQTLEGYHQGIAMDGYGAVREAHAVDSRILPVLVGHSAPDAAQRFFAGEAVVVPFRRTPEEMAECYQACDVTITTSRTEAFGRIPAESQACGVPVVSLDTGGLAEVVRDGVGGFVVSAGSPSALVERLLHLAADAALRAALGEGGRRHVVDHFDPEATARLHVDLYRDILAHGTA